MNGFDDDPLNGYTPNWRKQLGGFSSRSTAPIGDIDLRADDDPLAGYSPDWRKHFSSSPSVGAQARGAIEQVGEALRHPVRTVVGIAKSAAHDLDTFGRMVSAGMGDAPADPELATKSKGELARAVVNTAANAATPFIPTARFASRAALGAGLGAVNDPDQPIRGATAGVLLGETLHGAGALGRRVGRALDVTDGAIEAGVRGVDEELRADAGQDGQFTRASRERREAELAHTFNQRPETPAGPDWWEENAPIERGLPAPPERKLLAAGARQMPGAVSPEEALARARREAMLSESARVSENPPTSEEVLERVRARDAADRLETDREKALAPTEAPKAERLGEEVSPHAASKKYREMGSGDLYDQMIAEYDLIDSLQRDMGQHWTRYDDDVHTMLNGSTFGAGKARMQGKFAAQRLTRIEAELQRRGIGSDEIMETMQARREAAIERQALSAESASDDTLDFLYGENANKLGEPVPNDGPLAKTRVADEDGQLRRVYHGTSSPFESFDSGRNDPHSLYGPGFYFTENPEVASSYTRKGTSFDYEAAQRRAEANRRLLQTGAWDDGAPLTDTQRAAIQRNLTIDSDRLGSAGNVAPNVRVARVAMRKPFDVDAQVPREDAIAIVRHVIEGAPADAKTRTIGYLNRLAAENGGVFTGDQLYHALTQPSSLGWGKDRVNTALKAAGYDGITHIGGQIHGEIPHRVWIAFDRHQVRSAFDDAASARQVGEPELAQTPTRPIDAASVSEHETTSFGSPERRQRVAAQVQRLENLGLPTSEQRLSEVRGTKSHRPWVDLRGRQLQNTTDIHDALSAYRHPGMERLHVLLLDEDNRIVSHTAETSGSLANVDVGDGQRWIETITDRANRLGAKRVLLAHNHPSGDPTASHFDVAFTHNAGGELAQRGLRLLGHVVIDHTEGTLIAPGESGAEARRFQVSARPAADWQTAVEAGRPAVTPSTVGALVRDAADPEGLTAVYLDSQNRVVAVEPRPIKSAGSVANWVPTQLAAHNARRIVLAGPPEAARFMQRTVLNDRSLAPDSWAHHVFDIVEVQPNGEAAPTTLSYGQSGLLGRTHRAAPSYAGLKRLFEPEPDAGGSMGRGGSGSATAGAGGVPAAGGVSTEPLPLTDDARATFDAHAKSIDFDGAMARAFEHTQAGGLRDRLNRFADAIANGLGPIERLGEHAKVEVALPPSRNPRDLLSYVKSSDHTVRTFFNDGVIDPISREIVGPSFKSLFEPFGNDTDAIRRALTYVKAEREVGRGIDAVGGDEAALARAQRVVDYGRSDPQLRAFAKQWHAYVDGIGEYAVRSGLWTRDLWGRLKDSDALYVPFRRIMGTDVREIAEGLKTGPNSKKVVNVGPGVQRFEGSQKAIANPAEALAEYTGSVIRRADRYRIGAALFDAADALGLEGDYLLTPITPNDVPASMRGATAASVRAKAAGLGLDPEALAELTNSFDIKLDQDNPIIWKNGPDGKKQYAQVNSPDLWRAISAMNANEESALRAFLDVTIRPLRRVFVAATTGLNPRFSLVTNTIRDAIDLGAKTRADLSAADVARGYYEGIREIAGRSDLVHEADRSGLGSTSMYGKEADPLQFTQRAAPTSTSDVVATRVRDASLAPVRVLERVGEASDKAPRMAEYFSTLRKYEDRVRSGEWTPADLRLRAATNARGVTLDFANKPGNRVLRYFADYVPFFGPSLQAPVSFGRAAVRNPARVATAAAGAAVAATAIWALKHQLSPERREQYNDRPSTERAQFLLVPLPNDGVLRVPISQELGVVAAGVTAALDGIMEDDPRGGRVLQQAILRTLPPGIAEWVQGNPTVPLPGVQQVFENAKNRKDFGGAPVEPERLRRLPPSERRSPDESPTFDALAAGARAIGMNEMSPLKAENLVRGVASGATPLLTSVTDPIAARVMGRRIPTPVKSEFDRVNPMKALVSGDVPSATESEGDYYDLRTRAEQARNAFHLAVKSRDHDAVERLRGDAGLLDPFVKRGFDLSDAELDRIAKREKIVHRLHDAGELSSARAAQVLDGLRADRQLIYRNATRILQQRIAGSTSP